LVGLWLIAGKQVQSLRPLCIVILFTFLMVVVLEKPIGVADIAATEVASPDSNCATPSVVNVVIQNKLINVAVTTRLKVTIRFHNFTSVSFAYVAQRQ
jgi:hypothetical protein